MVAGSAAFTQILILQSLPAGELRTGVQLWEDLRSQAVARERAVGVVLKDIVSRSALAQALTDTSAAAAASGSGLILHIECHGNESGIRLSDGSFFTWQELRTPLVTINKATRYNLLVTLAACWGGYLINVIDPCDAAPLWGLIGPSAEENAGALLLNFTEFYSSLLNRAHEDRALDELLQRSGYLFTSADTFFQHSWGRYLKELDKRASDYQRQIRHAGPGYPPSLVQVRRALKRQSREDFSRCRRAFFMVELFTENNQRFPVSYDDIVAIAAGQ